MAEIKPAAWMDSPHGALRANHEYRWEFPPQPLSWQIPLYPPQALDAARAEERGRCAMEVWHTMMQATAEDADDRGLEGWMRSAEDAIRNLK